MSKAKQLEQVEQECKERGVKLIYDDLRSEGGLCRLRGSYYVILNRRLASETKTRIIVDALARVGDCPRTGTVPKAEEGTVPEGGLSPKPAHESAPVVVDFPELAYEEPEIGVPVTAGVPDSQS
jgi:hypothetical protein